MYLGVRAQGERVVVKLRRNRHGHTDYVSRELSALKHVGTHDNIVQVLGECAGYS